jgi:hypothetical protein
LRIYSYTYLYNMHVNTQWTMAVIWTLKFIARAQLYIIICIVHNSLFYYIFLRLATGFFSLFYSFQLGVLVLSNLTCFDYMYLMYNIIIIAFYSHIY